MGSVWRRYCVLSDKSNRQKKFAHCAVRIVRTDANVACLYADVAGPYRRHVAAPGDDTCQAYLGVRAYNWTYLEVTCVTTKRVTCGMGDVSS
jgi:hypothetical protein